MSEREWSQHGETKDHYHRAENVDDGRDTFYDRWEHERVLSKMQWLQKAGADLEQLLDFRHRAFIDCEHDHVIVGLDYGVVMRHDHLHISGGPFVVAFECRAFELAHNGADCRAFRQVDFLDAAADPL